MMRQYELVERVTRYNPHADENLLNKAYVYAMKKHGAQEIRPLGFYVCPTRPRRPCFAL